MAERDYPIWHPAAVDYDGTPYKPPKSPYDEDFPEGHPARGGANTGDADTPDGARRLLLAREEAARAKQAEKKGE